MKITFNKQFYKNVFIYLFILNLVHLIKTNFFQNSAPKIILMFLALGFQLFFALTAPLQERRRNKWLILIFVLSTIWTIYA
ncbi:hypothetical protein ABID29_001755 [Streptococcus rupicaprae]|uniref:Uncharacterized protein n=1 Tax=Streptococcus rupicaprae TaxID=759619 RepID=A0ABV2FJ74_9STRE